MNNKGFTLIELLATIILLAIVTSVTSYAVIGFINNSKENSYNILIENIKTGAQEYFEECENINIMGSALPENACNNLIKDYSYCQSLEGQQPDSCATITIGNLVKYGFLKTSATDDEGNKIIENPITNENLNTCTIEVLKYIDSSDYSSWYKFEYQGNNTICPTNNEYNK